MSTPLSAMSREQIAVLARHHKDAGDLTMEAVLNGVLEMDEHNALLRAEVDAMKDRLACLEAQGAPALDELTFKVTPLGARLIGRANVRLVRDEMGGVA